VRIPPDGDGKLRGEKGKTLRERKEERKRR